MEFGVEGWLHEKFAQDHFSFQIKRDNNLRLIGSPVVCRDACFAKVVR
jgi:hypothetical protein